MQAEKADISKLDRLKKRSDFLRVQKEGRKWVSRGLILQVAGRPDPAGSYPVRFGLTVSKRLSKSAVVRNRVKRRLRAVARDILPLCARGGNDYILIGRPETETRPYTALREDLKWCLQKLSCLAEEGEA